MDEKRKKSKLLLLLRLFNEETDEDHMVSLSDINSYLADKGVKPVDRKTLYSDFEELKQFGLDIMTEVISGKNYYYIGERHFQLPELKLLVDSVQASKYVTEQKSRDLIKKIEGLTSKYEAQELHRQVLITGRPKSVNESIYINVDILNRAINQNSQVKFQYFQWDVGKNMVLKHDGRIYTVSPWALVLDNENYYLVGYEGEKIKHYRVDKIKALQITGTPRIGQEHYHEEDYTKKIVFGMFGGEVVPVTLEAENWMAGIIIDRFGIEVPMVPVSKTRFEAKIEVALSKQFLGWIIGLGEDIKVVSPPAAVNLFKRETYRLMQQYLGIAPREDKDNSI